MTSEASPPVPLAIRRVATGHDSSGKSVVVLDSSPPRTDAYEHVPGLISRLVWATGHAIPFLDTDPTRELASFVPAPGETRLLIVTFPPDKVYSDPGFDPDKARQENLALSPGLAELFEPDGKHATPTIDYGILLDGELWLELDGGQQTLLRQFDVVIQNGTRHAWRNKTNQPATMAFILIGARSSIE